MRCRKELPQFGSRQGGGVLQNVPPSPRAALRVCLFRERRSSRPRVPREKRFEPREIMPEGGPAGQSPRIRTGTEEGTQQEPVSAGSSFALARGARGGRPYRHRGESRRAMTYGSGAGCIDTESLIGPQKVSNNCCWFPPQHPTLLVCNCSSLNIHTSATARPAAPP